MTLFSDCSHSSEILDCPAAGCYRSLPIPDTRSAFGLGKYTLGENGHGVFGALVHQLKYDYLNEFEYDRVLRELFRYVEFFAKARFERKFDYLVTVPSNRQAQSLPMRVCELLIAGGYAKEILELKKARELPVSKQLNHEERRATISGRYLVEDNRVASAANLLIVDDVFDSGSTIESVIEALRLVNKSTQIDVLVFTYLKDPKELQWRR